MVLCAAQTTGNEPRAERASAGVASGALWCGRLAARSACFVAGSTEHGWRPGFRSANAVTADPGIPRTEAIVSPGHEDETT
ncbi:hypothetical protein MRX96_043427 [Rhipicephalus microplus]